MGRKKEAEAADDNAITEHLVLVGFAKQKGTEAQPGYKIKLQGGLPAGAVTPGNEKDPLLPKHGLLKLTSRNLFDGVRTVTMTGKLKITRTAAHKESPAYQTWEFRLANVPTSEHASMLLELARANGDEAQAAVEAAFTETADEDARPEPDGPELFSDEDEEIERIKNEADPFTPEATQAAAEEFDQGQAANVVPGSAADDELQGAKRKRRRVESATA